MIKNLIFDFGKVLVDYDFFNSIRPYFHTDKDIEQFAKLFTSIEFLNKCDREEIPFSELIKQSQQTHPEFEFQLQKFYDNYTQFVICEIPGMKDLLIRLKAEGYKLYGLTNWCSKVHEVMQQWEIFSLLDGAVISSDEKLIKPEAAIYRRLCDKYSLNPEECIFTDDKEINIRGAENVGMKGILFVNAEQYEAELRNIITKVNFQ